MSAKEMFEKLDFVCDANEFSIVYDYKYDKFSIEFRLHNKDILFTDDRRYEKLTIEELQAINQQVKELGWYEQ
jgi:hypothetical protein